MDNDVKLTWNRPELIIINKCYVEESVLAFCNEQGPEPDPSCDVHSYEGSTS